MTLIFGLVAYWIGKDTTYGDDGVCIDSDWAFKIKGGDYVCTVTN